MRFLASGTFAPWLSSRALGIACATSLLLGCGGASAGGKNASRPLPAYAGHATELFDDDIEPRAVGIDLSMTPQVGSPRSDPMLRERTQVGDAVVRARIDTVTAKNDGVDARYDLGLRTLEKLAGEHGPGENFAVRIEQRSPSANIVKNFQDRLGGRVFIMFVREFVRPDGDTELHFHAAPDDKDVAGAVHDAAAMLPGR